MISLHNFVTQSLCWLASIAALGLGRCGTVFFCARERNIPPVVVMMERKLRSSSIPVKQAVIHVSTGLRNLHAGTVRLSGGCARHILLARSNVLCTHVPGNAQLPPAGIPSHIRVIRVDWAAGGGV
uniref:Putative secreted protein n=1 Tax=Anopheles darlingi TaxID=43151 RepID=A0A2M4DRY1_ANODA